MDVRRAAAGWLALALLFAAGGSARAAEYTWDNDGDDGKWEDVDNWNLGSLPGSTAFDDIVNGDTVTIDNGGTAVIDGETSDYVDGRVTEYDLFRIYLGNLDGGSGTLRLLDGKTLIFNDVVLGYSKNTNGVAVVSGAGSTLSAFTMEVGIRGIGRLDILDGGAVTARSVVIAGREGSRGAVLVGAGSSLTVNGGLLVGGSSPYILGDDAWLGGTGTLVVGVGGGGRNLQHRHALGGRHLRRHRHAQHHRRPRLQGRPQPLGRRHPASRSRRGRCRRPDRSLRRD